MNNNDKTSKAHSLTSLSIKLDRRMIFDQKSKTHSMSTETEHQLELCDSQTKVL